MSRTTMSCTKRSAFAATLILCCFSVSAFGQSFATLHQFNRKTDGSVPFGGLLADQQGNLFGTTSGATNTDIGTVFELSPPATGGTWTDTVLFTFPSLTTGGPCGSYPSGPLIADAAGNLYGTATYGGSGYGTVFQLVPPATSGGAWTCNALYTFAGGTDAANPGDGVILDPVGNLYGGTAFAGAYGEGSVFRLAPPAVQGGAWTETVLYSFHYISNKKNDGWFPNRLVLGRSGELYGTAQNGGSSDKGTVFRLKPPAAGQTAWTEQTLYNFTGGLDGGSPASSLIFDRAGNLYGTTQYGGSCTRVSFGCGVVFELLHPAAPGGAWTQTVLYSFTDGSDGSAPYSPVTFDPAGDLYGTTTGTLSCSSAGCGAVFKLAPPGSQDGTWTETTLYTFPLGNYGVVSGLTIGKNARLYGTTGFGGNGNGTVFRVVP